MYTQVENPVALTTHLQDDRFDYVVLYFYMAPLQCCAETLKCLPQPTLLFYIATQLPKANQTSTPIALSKKCRGTLELMEFHSWRLIWALRTFPMSTPPSGLLRFPNSRSVVKTDDPMSDWLSEHLEMYPQLFAATAESISTVPKS